MIAAAVILVCVGTVGGVLSTSLLTRANRGWRIPMVFGRPLALPGSSRALLAISVGVLALGAGVVSPVWGYWSVVLVLWGSVIPLAQLLRHNHEVASGHQDAP